MRLPPPDLQGPGGTRPPGAAGEGKSPGLRLRRRAERGPAGLARELGFSLRGDFGLNVFNSRSLEQLRDWGLESACLSFELRHEQIRDLRKPLPCETLVYGRLPLMVVENCLVRNGLGCTSRDLYGPLCRRPQPHRPAGGSLSHPAGVRLPQRAGKQPPPLSGG